SLVIKISYGATSALLEGDAEKKTEKQVAQEDPQADLLKVAHHGSSTSTIPELLAAVHPRFAVISVGTRNVYGHPRQEVLDRLAEEHIPRFQVRPASAGIPQSIAVPRRHLPRAPESRSLRRRAECPAGRRAKSGQSQCRRIRASRAPPWLPTPVRYRTRAPVS